MSRLRVVVSAPAWRRAVLVHLGALLLCLAAGALEAAPTVGQSSTCLRQALPADATVVASGPQVLIYAFGQPEPDSYFACLEPSGSPIQLTIARPPAQAEFSIAGQWVGYLVYQSGDPVITFTTLDTATARGATYLLGSDATVNAFGDVLGTQRAVALPGQVLQHDLVLYTPSSSVPVELDPAATDRATFSGAGVAITRGARHLTVDPGAGTPPRPRVSACHALNRRLVRAAGGAGAGRDTLILEGSGRAVCAWGALELVDHPENRSERAALLASAHADRLQFIRIDGVTGFVYRESGPPTLLRVFVPTRAGLIELAAVTSHQNRALAGLEAAAAAAVRALRR